MIDRPLGPHDARAREGLAWTRGVPYKHVVAMLDELKRVGIRQLRFIPKQRLTNRLRRATRQPCGAEEPDLVIDLEGIEDIEDDD